MFPDGGFSLGPYEILGLLGEGGMGRVYRARDPRLGREVAIKVLPEAFGKDRDRLAQFQREARTVAHLNHPNIVVLYSVEQAADTPFLTLELVEGRDLSSEIRPEGMPLRQVLQIALALTDAMTAAHERGVVHRDLKPANIRITPEGRVKVLDFGLAKFLSVPEPPRADPREAAPTADTVALSPQSQVGGTVPYMAPEQLQGLPADAGTDLFAFGVLLFEMVAGRRPFLGETVAEVCLAILRGDPPPLTALRQDLPPDLVRVVTRCLEKRPEWRYPSAKEVHAHLEGVARTLDSLPLSTAPPALSGPLQELPSIAVLPFSNRGGGPEDEYFADGITEDVIAHLCKLKMLRVIARTSVMPFREHAEDLQAIAAKLQVRHMLEGSVRRVRDRVRIVAQLVDTATGEHLWAETYDRALDDIFAIQADVATQIATALRAQLSPHEEERLRKRPTQDLLAYEHFLRGRHAFVRFTPEETARAIAHFQRAIDRDPAFALAHVGLSLAYTELAEATNRSRGELKPKAMAAAAKAILLDPHLGEAHCALAYATAAFDMDWEGAEKGFRRAIELNPNDSDAYDLFGRMCAGMGRFDEAIALQQRAFELDPLTHKADLANAFLRAGRNKEALRAARAAVDADPDYPRAHATLGWALFLSGAAEEGLAEIRRAVELAQGADQWLAQAGQAEALLGRMDLAREKLALLRDPARPTPASPYHLAYLHTGLGEADEAIDCLEQAFEEGLGAIYGIQGSFLLAPLRGHPRFQALLRRMRLG